MMLSVFSVSFHLQSEMESETTSLWKPGKETNIIDTISWSIIKTDRILEAFTVMLS